jgi:hypothetical protein
MKKLKAVLGYIVAALMLPVVIVTFMSLGPLSELLVKTTGIQISPWFSGGTVAQTIEHEKYATQIHRPVFDALIGERKEGFVQVVWLPKLILPNTIEETIDYDGDGQPDFRVTLHTDTKTAEWQPLTQQALGFDGPYRIGEGMGVRIRLRNK